MNCLMLATFPLLLAATISTTINDPKPGVSDRGSLDLDNGHHFNYSVVSYVGEKAINAAVPTVIESRDVLPDYDPLEALRLIHQAAAGEPVYLTYRYPTPEPGPEGIYLFVSVELEVR